MRRLVPSLTCAFVLLAAGSAATPARADHCDPVVGVAPAPGGSAAVELELARYRNERGQGWWTGLRLGAGLASDRVGARVFLPFYRLERDGSGTTGPGDVGLSARLRAWRSGDDLVSVGPALAVTLPTGDAEAGLGMGHTMLMPGAWASLVAGRLSLAAAASYGFGLGGAHGHHAASGPIVDPMNASELAGSASVGWQLTEVLRADASFFLAEPVASAGAERRASGGLGVSLSAGRFELGAAVHVPLVGRPFQLRTLATVSLAL